MKSSSVSAGDVISRSPDPSNDVTEKSCDQSEVEKSVDDADKSFGANFSFSDFPECADIEVSHGLSNNLHDVINESHDIINESHDLFNQSHELLESATSKSHDLLDKVTEKPHGLMENVQNWSHDQSNDVTARSHDQSDDVTVKSHDLTHYLVLERAVQDCVEDEEHGTSRRRKSEVLLRLLDQTSSTERLVYLRDEW